jgi:ankyrin repeat protein
MIHNYFNFKDSLNENIQRAKVYLKKRALRKKESESEDTDQPVGLSADEVRVIENDPSFQEIKRICRDVPGWVYLFTKIFYEDYEGDVDRLKELEDFYKEIKSYGNLIKNLPQPLENYANPTTETPSSGESGDVVHAGRTITERIVDDLEVVKLEVLFNKFKGEFLPHQKKQVETATKQQREKLLNIAKEFSEMGKDDDGNIDLEYQYSLYRIFYSKLKDFSTLQSLIDFALNYIKSVNNNQFSKFIKKIDEVNTRFGPQNGAKLIYNNDAYLVIEVYSYVANRVLNGHTTHCIARSQSYWDNYLEGVNKQYYVYNFNLGPTEPMSVIGLTIRPDGTYADLKNKLNDSVPNFKELMKNWKIPMDLLAPPTAEEVAEKRKRIEASKKIIQSELSFEELQECLENGADPNARGGKPLKNAIESNDKESVKLLLQKGASPNIGEGVEAPISFASDLDMIKILVNGGATIVPNVFLKVSDDIESVRYLLEAGMDPNFSMGYAFRNAARHGNIDIMKLMLEYAKNVPEEKLSIREKEILIIKERNFLAIKTAAEYDKMDIIIFLLDRLYELKYEEMEDPEIFTKSLIDHMTSSRTLARKPEIQKRSIETVKNWTKSKSDAKNESKRFKSFGYFKY